MKGKSLALSFAPMILGLQGPIGELGYGETYRAASIGKAPRREKVDAVRLAKDGFGQNLAGNGGCVKAVAAKGGEVPDIGLQLADLGHEVAGIAHQT